MKLSFLAAPAVLLAAAPLMAQAMSPADYVKTAGASDLYERTSSQVVLQTTRDPRIRAFAQMMLTDHAKSTNDVKHAAMASHVRPMPPVLTPAQAEMVAQLRAEQGAARDAAYVAQQRASHDQALAVQQAYAADGTAPALRRVAGTIVPVVQHHIQMLMQM
ncbi:DUF4142 domain-containing protein [Sphingomonas sp.]|uniref:DUF4142 domain-containing protein n=1 Tax=Sphingomonas sp. TaxID=28214 RepID=UPI003CC69A80